MPPHPQLPAAVAHQQAGRYVEARAAYEAVLADDPTNYDALCNLSVVFFQCQDYGEAEALARKGIETWPAEANAWNNLGRAVAAQGRNEEAHESYKKCLQMDRNHSVAWNNLGQSLVRQGKFDDAIRALRQSLTLNSNYAPALEMYIHQCQQTASWSDLDRWVGELHRQIERAEQSISPFSLLFLCYDPGQMLKCARTLSRHIYEDAKKSGAVSFTFEKKEEADRIRVGYVSADFYGHPTALLTAQLFEAHDRSRFEVFCYSHSPADDSVLRKRIVAGAEHFVEVGDETHQETAQRIHNDGIDILVDLKGYTKEARPQIFAHRPAPIQVSWLGYPGTLGASFMDYIIADRYLVPTDLEQFYDEQCVFMPVCYQVNDAARKIADKTPQREELGIDPDAVIFCCFNQIAKITPPLFDVWATILQQVPNSVLWLWASNPFAEASLKREAVTRGIAAERIILAEPVDNADHLARYRLADLSLDTFPCNGHTTASDALFVGCPVLTYSGKTFASRVAGSLLSALGLDDLISSDFQSYARMAIDFGRDSSKRSALRQRLNDAKQDHPVFDGEAFTRHLEQAYESMQQRYQQGEPARHIVVE